MNKQVEQIRAEIERLKEENSIGLSEYDAGYCNGVGEICEHLLSFIKSQPDEQVSEDLEKAAIEAFKQIVDNGKNSFLEIFKAGSNWRKEQMMKDAINGYIERDMGGQLIVGMPNHGYYGAVDEFMLLNSHLFQDVKCGRKFNAKLIIIKED